MKIAFIVILVFVLISIPTLLYARRKKRLKYPVEKLPSLEAANVLMEQNIDIPEADIQIPAPQAGSYSPTHIEEHIPNNSYDNYETICVVPMITETDDFDIPFVIEGENSCSEQDVIYENANFETALSLVFNVEGGYQNSLTDGGNKNRNGEYVGTNHGVTARVYENYRRDILGDVGYIATITDMKNITVSEAKTILYELYFKKIKGDQIISQNITNIMFDAYVNRPVQMKELQMAVNSLGYNISVDGVIGNQSILTINEIVQNGQTAFLYNEFKRLRKQDYTELANAQPHKFLVPVNSYQNTWLDIWLMRVDSFTAYNNIV